MSKFAFSLSMIIAMLSCQQAVKEDQPLSEFEIEEGFQIELVAIEPLISDPVDMEIDELGRWFVVEMHGYPLDVSGTGVIKRLMDTDEDGKPDQSTVFIDGLILPTGIMRWKNGFLVTDPPNVLYLEDADDDGKAEIRDTVLTGFARSNPQHNLNNPLYSLDNWVYLGHEGSVSTIDFAEVFGDEGSAVHFPDSPQAARLPKNANGLGVRFRPDEKEVEILSSYTQFSHTFDPSGHYFQTNNASHLYHEVIASQYLSRNPKLLIPSGQQYIPRSGRGFEIYPITTNPEHQLLTDIGVMTSACGILWYQGGLFPPDYDATIFTAEPVHNLIHVDIINEKGATFESVPLLDGHEFLASRDSWFRPVNHYIGPDGALYVLDYHRKIIEHPEWLSEQVIEGGDLYQGIDQGRIYRISPAGTGPMQFMDKLNLAAMTSDQLIQLLENKNIWWRTHAQRLLMDRQDPAIISATRKFLSVTQSPAGKVHAIWVLEGKNSMDQSLILPLLGDESAGVRENALKLAEFHLATYPDLVETLLKMVNDPSPQVRFQLLLTLGEMEDQKAAEARMRLLIRDIDDPWVQYAALSARNMNLSQLYTWSVREFEKRQTPGAQSFFKKLSETMVRSSNSNELNNFLKDILASSKQHWFDPLVLDGITNALSRNQELKITPGNRTLLTGKFSDKVDPLVRTSSLNVLNAAGFFKNKNNPLLNQALEVVKNDLVNLSLKVDAIRIIGWTNPGDHLNLLKSVMENESSAEVRMAILEALDHVQDHSGTDFLTAIWPDLLPEERSKGIQIFLHGDARRLALLKAIEEQKIQTTNLSWSNTVSLLNSSNHEIRTKARSLLHGNELDADVVWQQYEKTLELTGNRQNGIAVFSKNCGICHQVKGENGIAFGPDLSAMQNRNKASLLIDILQPNKSIADGYELWTLESNSGNLYSGIISNQSPNTVTIKDATGKEETIERSDIKNMKAMELSAMPENLHMQVSLQEMADLLAYLKNE